MYILVYTIGIKMRVTPSEIKRNVQNSEYLKKLK